MEYYSYSLDWGVTVNGILFIQLRLGRHCQGNNIYTFWTGALSVKGIKFIHSGLGRHCQWNTFHTAWSGESLASMTIHTAWTRATLSREYYSYSRTRASSSTAWAGATLSREYYSYSLGWGVTVKGILFIQPGLGSHWQV